MEAVLTAQKRAEHGKGAARQMRATGRVPAVLYGRGAETVSLSVDAREAVHLFHGISVENTIIDLTIEGEKGAVVALVREIQVHPFRPDLVHIDFYRIQEGVKVELAVPIHLQGIPSGVKHHGGTLQQVIYELPVKVLPAHIPESFEVDVEHLETGDSVHVSDLELDDEIEVLIDMERTICAVAAPRGVAEEEEEEEEELLEGEEAVEEEGAEDTDEA